LLLHSLFAPRFVAFFYVGNDCFQNAIGGI